MSSTVYARAILSEAERRRLEEEDRRRREEEERLRREAEERRKREERERADRLVSLAKDLREKIAAALAAKPPRQVETPEASDRHRVPTHEETVKRTREEMLQTIETIKLLLAGIPDEFRRIRRSRLSGIEHELSDIESKRDYNFTTHFERLKLLKSELNRVIDSPEEQVETWHRSIEELSDMKFTLQLLADDSVSETLRTRAMHLLEDISAHIEVADIDSIQRSLFNLRKMQRSMVHDIERERSSRAEREIIGDKITETLEEMGYRATAVASEHPRDGGCDDAHADIFFRTPSNDAVRIVLGRDHMIKTEFIRVCGGDAPLEGGAFDDAVARCRRWCRALPDLQEGLRKRGVGLNIEGVMPAERGGFGVMDVGRFASQREATAEEEEYYPREHERERETE